MNKIRVENFRSINDSGVIDLRPITIAIGRNSAGKSSFVRVFPLLKQTLEKKTAEPILWYGDYVDFGSFKHTVSKEKTSSSVRFTFEIDVDISRFPSYLGGDGQDITAINVSLSVRENYFENIKIQFKDQVILIEFDEKKKVRLIINEDSNIFDEKNIYVLNRMGDIIPNLYQKEKSKDGMNWGLLTSKKLVDKCNNYIFEKSVKRERGWMFYHGDLGIELGSKQEILNQFKRINKAKFSGKTITHKMFQRYNNYIIAINISDLINKINYSVQNNMRQTSYIKPIRAMVNRYYRVQGISTNEVDADGSNLPMILQNMSKEQRSEFELWSKDKFGIVFSVTTTEGHISLIIKNDVDSSEETNLADAGYGYSQMLPIVTLLWMLHKEGTSFPMGINRTVVIEQPELHLHPAYQAKMMDVFVNVIKEARDNRIRFRIIFETHSETMINRLGLLIADKKISKDDVGILVFDKKDGRTSISCEEYDNDGILSGWPVDFFSPEDED